MLLTRLRHDRGVVPFPFPISLCCSRKIALDGRIEWGVRYSSSRRRLSSISISLNSLDSNTSPHSLHSTYSESSSRDTICTCGCLQWSGLTFCLEDCEGWIGVMASRTVRLSQKGGRFVEIGGILGRVGLDVKSPEATGGGYQPRRVSQGCLWSAASPCPGLSPNP